MSSGPAFTDGTKPAPPDGSTMPVWSVAHLAKRIGLTETLPLTPQRYHFPNARGSALREW
jgi:hypothetical protein